MGRVKAVEIKEGEQELLQLSRKVKHPLAQARLWSLYLYKSGQARSYEQIAKAVGYERHAVGHWFKQYQQQGLAGCLEINAGGKPKGSLITGQALAALQAKLADPVNYFTSYKQIHQWLAQEHGIKLSYEHVHRFVRYYLKAKLKVVRKSNLKKDVVKEEKYKKN
jgi:transposase